MLIYIHKMSVYKLRKQMTATQLVAFIETHKTRVV